jgi:hypothetical protein
MGLACTEFEWRQMAAIRKELDEVYKAGSSLDKSRMFLTQIIQQFSEARARWPKSPMEEVARPVRIRTRADLVDQCAGREHGSAKMKEGKAGTIRRRSEHKKNSFCDSAVRRVIADDSYDANRTRLPSARWGSIPPFRQDA